MSWPDRREVRDTGIYVRSGIEEQFAERLLDEGIDFDYEPREIEGEVDQETVRYVPDFWIDDTVVELKGRATSEDEKKGLMFISERDEEYTILGDTGIHRIPANRHFDFNEQFEEAIDYIK